MFFKRIVLFLFILGGIFLSLWSCGDGGSDSKAPGTKNFDFVNFEENDLKYAPKMDILKCKARTINCEDYPIQITGQRTCTNSDLSTASGGSTGFHNLTEHHLFFGAVQSCNDPDPVNVRFKGFSGTLLGSGNNMSHDTLEIVGRMAYRRNQQDKVFYARPQGSLSIRPVGFAGIKKLDSYGLQTDLIDYTGLSDPNLSASQRQQLEQLRDTLKNQNLVVFTNLVYRNKTSNNYDLGRANYIVRVNTFIPRDSILEVDVEKWDRSQESVDFPSDDSISVEIHYLVIPEGTYTFSGDKDWDYNNQSYNLSGPSRYNEYVLEVGTARTTHEFTTVELQNDFTGGPPFIKIDWQSQVSQDPYDTNRVPRIRNIRIDNINNGRDSFEVKLDLPSGGTQYYAETVSYMALGAKNGRKSNVVNNYGWLKVDNENGKLLDERGDWAQLKGMSGFWPNWSDGGRLVNSSVIDWLVDKWGIQVYRLPIGVDPKDPKLITGKRIDQSGFIFDPEKRYARLCQIINYCIYKGIYIIVDWHIHDGLGKIEYESGEKESEYFEEGTKYEDIAAALFSALAKKYKDNPNVLFEIWNEPSKIDHLGDKPLIFWDGIDNDEYEDYVNQGPGPEDDKDLKGYAYRIIPAIREQEESGKAHVIISPSSCWDQWIDQVQKLVQYENIMYSFHFYAGSHLPVKEDGNGDIPVIGVGDRSLANRAGLTDAVDKPSIILNGDGVNQITQEDYDYMRQFIDPVIYNETPRPDQVMLLWQLNVEPFDRLNYAVGTNKIPVFATEWGTSTYDGGGVFPNDLDETAFGLTTGDNGTVYENGVLLTDQYGLPINSDRITSMRLAIYPKSAITWLKYFDDHKISWCNWSISDRHEGASMLKNFVADPNTGQQTNVCLYGGWLERELTESGKFMRDVFTGAYENDGVSGTK